jgi:hypothetical protein
MIRINVQSAENLKLNQAVAKFVNDFKQRSFSGRHLNLGKMVNCPVCDRRHRSSIICVPKYAVGKYDPEKKPLIASQTTHKGVYGAAAFAKKRLHPHPSKRGLLLIERTQKLFHENEPFFKVPQENMEFSRIHATRELRAERSERSRATRRQRSIAYRINLGLAKNGSR